MYILQRVLSSQRFLNVSALVRALTERTLGDHSVRQLGRLADSHLVLRAHLEHVLVARHQSRHLELARARPADLRVATSVRVSLLHDVARDLSPTVALWGRPLQCDVVLRHARDGEVLWSSRSACGRMQ